MENKNVIPANASKQLAPLRGKIYDFVDSQLTQAVLETPKDTATVLTSEWIVNLVNSVVTEYNVQYTCSGMYNLALRRSKVIGAGVMFTQTTMIWRDAKKKKAKNVEGPLCTALQTAFETFLAEHVQPIEKKMLALDAELSDAKELLRVLAPLRKAAEDASKVIVKHGSK